MFCQRHIFGITVAYQIQLGKHRQPALQKLVNDPRMGDGSRTHKPGIILPGGQRLGNARIGRDAQLCRLCAALGAGIHTEHLNGRVDAFDKAGAALAHAAQANDQQFHGKNSLTV